jgi:hypothetical protein
MAVIPLVQIARSPKHEYRNWRAWISPCDPRPLFLYPLWVFSWQVGFAAWANKKFKPAA